MPRRNIRPTVSADRRQAERDRKRKRLDAARKRPNRNANPNR